MHTRSRIATVLMLSSFLAACASGPLSGREKGALAGGALGAGAVIGNRGLRLVRIDGYRVEAVPEGYFLMLHNRDVPGVVSAVGSMLGQAGINIAGLELGRDRAGGMALSLVEVDGAVPAEVLERLRQ